MRDYIGLALALAFVGLTIAGAITTNAPPLVRPPLTHGAHR